MMFKRFLVLTPFLVSWLVILTMQVQATPIILTPDGADGTVAPSFSTSDNSNLNADDVETLVGSTVELTELYKADAPGEDNDPPLTESGDFAGDYTTDFDPDTEPESAWITFDGSGADAITNGLWLLAKDGNQDPAQYVWDISGWDGEMDLHVENPWPQQGAISHVAIYGVTAIPEPGTLLLLGSGIVGLGLWRWRKVKESSS